MNCPIDSTQLVMSDRSGIEIDYCPQCRGVWLDRGELDKILERENQMLAQQPQQQQPAPQAPQVVQQQPGYPPYGYGYNNGHGRGGGLLGSLFGGSGGRHH